ncbi:high mobility group box domain-containing protein, partial [Abortiporus biennis]
PEEEEHIPRPPNSYMLYRVDGLTPLQVQFEKEHQKRLSMTDASKILGPRWANESAEVRQEYERRAKVARAEHDKKYPNYVFKPVKKK